MRPLIAVTGRVLALGRVERWLEPAVASPSYYLDALWRAGGYGVVLGPEPLDDEAAGGVVARFDGLLLTGGVDVEPTCYGAEAAPQTYGCDAALDAFEASLLHVALAAQRPVLAICRGAQLLNVVLGGTLDQHISDREGLVLHGIPNGGGGSDVDVSISAGSRLAGAMEVTTATGRCHHHQAIDVVGDGLDVTARASDGTIEAIERNGHPWVVGVQWHPEDSADRDHAQQSLFDRFVTEAAASRRAGDLSVRVASAAVPRDDAAPTPPTIPERGRPADELLAEVELAHAEDIDWRGGKAFSLVYHPDDDDLEDLLEEVGRRYLHENALNPFKYPSVLRMEQEIVAMAADLFGTAPRAGAVTSGGTESIFCAVQVARDHARQERGIAEPELLTPVTAHPAFAKAAKYLDMSHVTVEVGDDGRADPATMAAAITDRTGLMVGSAPCYPFGVIDPIDELAGLAVERGILFHTDACLGGWLLPWWERLGEVVPPWDFRVPGVTSLSADVHKYGYTFKGASTVLYRDRSLLEHQFFWYDAWPGGLYASGTTAGTRPAAPIAGAWTAINHLGVDGYLRLARIVRDTTHRFQRGIADIDGMRLTHQPDLSVFQFTSDGTDIGAIADVMDDRGWHLDRQQGGLHLMISPYHARVADEFLADLADAASTGAESRGTAATYGGVA